MDPKFSGIYSLKEKGRKEGKYRVPPLLQLLFPNGHFPENLFPFLAFFCPFLLIASPPSVPPRSPKRTKEGHCDLFQSLFLTKETRTDFVQRPAALTKLTNNKETKEKEYYKNKKCTILHSNKVSTFLSEGLSRNYY